MKKRIIVIFIVVAVAVGVSAYFLSNGKESIYAGTVEVTRVDISPRVSSVIEKLFVDEGAHVKKGDPLFLLTCEDVKIRKDKLSSDFERGSKLFANGNIPKEAFDHIKSDYEDAMLRYDWCSNNSPIDGTVLNKYREEGELVSPGMKVFTLADLRLVWVYVYVDQPLMSSIKLGQKVKGFLPELDKKMLEGTVIHINDEAEFTPKNTQTRKERTRLVYGIKVSFPNQDDTLKPGMPVEITF